MNKVQTQEQVEIIFRSRNTVNMLTAQLVRAMQQNEKAKIEKLTRRINAIKAEIRQQYDVIL